MLLHVCVSLYVTYITVTFICRHCELVRCQIHNVGEVGNFLSENNGIVSVDELLLGYCGSYLKESLHPSLSSSSLLHSLVNCLYEFMITFFSIKRKITKLIELIRFIFYHFTLFTEICLNCWKDVHVLCAFQSRTQLKVIQILNEYHISICYTLLRKSTGKVVSANDVVNAFEVFSVSNFCRVIYGICSNTFWR